MSANPNQEHLGSDSVTPESRAASFTPGPWAIHGGEYTGARIDGPNGRSVAHAIQRDAHPTHGQGITQSEAEANARLIAAAPDMLQMLQIVERYFDSEEPHPILQADINDVIASATGAA
jgi:hypothetical protein